MTSFAIYYQWLCHAATGRATILLWTNRFGQLLLPAAATTTTAAATTTWMSVHRVTDTRYPWLNVEQVPAPPVASVLQWTLYEWIYLRYHLTAGVEQTDDETHRWVCLMWQAQAPHRIPITMVVRQQEGSLRWGQPYSVQSTGEVRVCCWFDGPWKACWDVAQIPTVELPPNPTQKSRHVVDDSRVQTVPSHGTQTPAATGPSFPRRRRT